MNKKLIIIGAGGHGKVCANVALDMQKWDEIFFLDDVKTGKVNGHEIIGRFSNDQFDSLDYDYFIGVGDNRLRSVIYNNLESFNVSITTLIHPSAYVSSHSKHRIATGTIIMPNVTIQSNVEIDKGVIVNTGVIIDHDTCVKKFSHISPGVKLAGNVKIGELTWVGIGAVIVNNVSIANHTIIGAQSLVLKSITHSGIYFGSPVQKKGELYE